MPKKHVYSIYIGTKVNETILAEIGLGSEDFLLSHTQRLRPNCVTEICGSPDRFVRQQLRLLIFAYIFIRLIQGNVKCFSQ
jgi:hypothetical protein